MMEALMRRGEILAAAEERRQARQLAARLKTVLGQGSVEAIGADVVVSGRGVLKRWVIDPGLRFLSSGLR